MTESTTVSVDPSNADLSVAARFHDGGVGFGIVNNDASELYVVVEVPKPKCSLRSLTER